MFRLSFLDNELLETTFRSPFTNETVQAVRGRSAIFHEGWGTFVWSSAVHAMAIVFLKAKTAVFGTHNGIVSGMACSPASSLDYSIAKNTQWLSDIFGNDSRGRSFAGRVFQRMNSHRRRPGPVSVMVNRAILKASDIEVLSEGNSIEAQEELLTLLAKLEESWVRTYSNSTEITANANLEDLKLAS